MSVPGIYYHTGKFWFGFGVNMSRKPRLDIRTLYSNTLVGYFGL